MNKKDVKRRIGLIKDFKDAGKLPIAEWHYRRLFTDFVDAVANGECKKPRKAAKAILKAYGLLPYIPGAS